MHWIILLVYNYVFHTFLHALAAVQHVLRTFTMLRIERDGFAVEFGFAKHCECPNQVALPLMHE